MHRKFELMARYLHGDSLRLYTLIWQRTMASQMASAVLDQVAVDIAGGGNKAVFRATGSTVVFDGWFRIYKDNNDDDDDKIAGGGHGRRNPLAAGEGKIPSRNRN